MVKFIAMPRSFLITRPNHDIATAYLSVYSQLLIDQAVKKQFTVVDLAGQLANPKNFHQKIKSQFSLILLNGHGSSHIINGQDNQPLITAPVSEFDFQSAIIYARSCQTATALGPYLILHHATAFIGYQNDFILVTLDESDPIHDPLAKFFLTPSNAIVSSLINGRTVGYSNRRSRKMTLKNLQSVLKSRVKTRREIAAYLWHNIKYQLVLGNDQSRISTN